MPIFRQEYAIRRTEQQVADCQMPWGTAGRWEAPRAAWLHSRARGGQRRHEERAAAILDDAVARRAGMAPPSGASPWPSANPVTRHTDEEGRVTGETVRPDGPWLAAAWLTWRGGIRLHIRAVLAAETEPLRLSALARRATLRTIAPAAWLALPTVWGVSGLPWQTLTPTVRTWIAVVWLAGILIAVRWAMSAWQALVIARRWGWGAPDLTPANRAAGVGGTGAGTPHGATDDAAARAAAIQAAAAAIQAAQHHPGGGA